MDLTTPLASLMNELEAAALVVLARSESEYTGRQVAQLATRGNAASIRIALLRLVEVGLVNLRTVSNFTFYRANRDHLLWESVEKALMARQLFITKLVAFLHRAAPDGCTVALYGSVARRTSTGASDIDLLVVYRDDEPVDSRDRFSDSLRSTVEAWTGNAVQIYESSVAELRASVRRRDPIVESWKLDAQSLLGDVHNLLETA